MRKLIFYFKIIYLIFYVYDLFFLQISKARSDIVVVSYQILETLNNCKIIFSFDCGFQSHCTTRYDCGIMRYIKHQNAPFSLAFILFFYLY